MRHDDHNADELLGGFAPGTPFGEELERALRAADGPVGADPREAEAAAARLRARMGAGVARRARWPWVAAAAAVGLVAFASRWSRPQVAVATAPPPAGWVQVIQAPETTLNRSAHTLSLSEGALRLPDTPDGGVVAVEAVGVVVRPEPGSDLVVGVAGDGVGLGVLAGRAVVERVGREALEVGDGGWVLVVSGDPIPFDADTPPDWAAVPAAVDGAGLVTRLRWLALPESTRAGVRP